MTNLQWLCAENKLHVSLAATANMRLELLSSERLLPRFRHTQKAHEPSKLPNPWNLADEARTANVAQLLSGGFGEFVCTWLSSSQTRAGQDSFYQKVHR